MEFIGGIKKILDKGAREPEAVRFHVPKDGGGWSQVTWGELRERSCQIACALDSLGVGKDDKVAVFATTRVEWAYCCGAIEACRAVFVPVYFSSTADQAQYVVNHSDARLLFVEQALLGSVLARFRDYQKLERIVVWDLAGAEALAAAVQQANESNAGLDLTLDEVEAKVVSLESFYQQGAERLEAEPECVREMVEGIQGSDVAAIIYTSGTTGEPKGVVLTIDNLISTTKSWYQVLEHAFPAVGERRDILWLPVSHMSGWGILGQGTLFEYETWLSNPFELLKILPEVRPTMLLSVPAYWEKLYTIALNCSDDTAEQYAKLQAMTGGALSFLLSGGAGLDREIKEFYHRAGLPMIEGYGLTECSPNLTMNRLDDFDLESVGKPMPGVEIQIADDGEILAKGPNVFSGYYKKPEETRAVFDEAGWFHTGDLGEWTDAGFIRFKGRKKEIIVTKGGKKIGPAGIEAMFVSDPFVEHIVLYGDEKKYLVALLTLDEQVVAHWAKQQGFPEAPHAEILGRAELRDQLAACIDRVNDKLSSYETIKNFHIHPGHLSVTEGHLTASLKLRRRKVWEAFEEQFEALY